LFAHYVRLHSLANKSSGERANGGHLREMQDKTKNIHEVQTLYKLAFSLKGLVLKYAV
jgi:hypothetical protein